MYGIVKKKF